MATDVLATQCRQGISSYGIDIKGSNIKVTNPTIYNMQKQRSSHGTMDKLGNSTLHTD